MSMTSVGFTKLPGLIDKESTVFCSLLNLQELKSLNRLFLTNCLLLTLSTKKIECLFTKLMNWGWMMVESIDCHWQISPEPVWS